MTLQQLRYVMQVVSANSMTLAAKQLFITQPSLSKSIAELEREMGIIIFKRTNRGVSLSDDGMRFLSYARQVLEQADRLDSRFRTGKPVKKVFSVSVPHYSFAGSAFRALLSGYGGSEYEFFLHETGMGDVLEDVRIGRSELGILCLPLSKKTSILRNLRMEGLAWKPLALSPVHIYMNENHPLAKADEVSAADLSPYPKLSYEQKQSGWNLFSEELHEEETLHKELIVTDRATLLRMMITLQGYMVGPEILSKHMHKGFISQPLAGAGETEMGYIADKNRMLSELAEAFIRCVKETLGLSET